jgi:hypothetical protein
LAGRARKRVILGSEGGVFGKKRGPNIALVFTDKFISINYNMFPVIYLQPAKDSERGLHSGEGVG